VEKCQTLAESCCDNAISKGRNGNMVGCHFFVLDVSYSSRTPSNGVAVLPVGLLSLPYSKQAKSHLLIKYLTNALMKSNVSQ
jgi:hypothetical protein